jgi:hypothetical protein
VRTVREIIQKICQSISPRTFSHLCENCEAGNRLAQLYFETEQDQPCLYQYYLYQYYLYQYYLYQYYLYQSYLY